MNKEASAILAGFLVATTAYLTWECRGRQLPETNTVNIAPGNSIDLTGNDLKSVDKALVDQAINNYRNAKNNDANVFQTFLKINPSDSTILLAHQMSRNYLMEGVGLLQLKLDPESKPIFTDKEGQTLVLNSREFDLNDLYQFHLASAIVDKTLEGYIGLRENLDYKSLLKQLQLLYWLKDQDIDVRFENDSFAFFSPDKLVAMAASLFYSGDDMPEPNRVQFYRYGDTRYPDEEQFAVYACQKYTSLKESFQSIFNERYKGKDCPIIISNVLDSTGISHEIGHFVGYNAENYNNGDFEELVKSLNEQYSQQIIDISNTFLTEHAADNIIEDYAETFAFYITKGNDFRQLLKQLRSTDWGAYRVLLGKYNFFEEKLGGFEFSRDGLTIDFDPELITYQSPPKYEVGNQTVIFDLRSTDQQNKGIVLRTSPYRKDSVDDSLVVHNFDQVQIIEGPLGYATIEDGEIENYSFWKIKVTTQDESGNPKDIEGWIGDEWLLSNVQEFIGSYQIEITPLTN